MGEHDNMDLDLELEKSIEKLVDEETSVAKAFVDRTAGHQSATPAENPLDSISDRKTQIIPNLGSRTVSLEEDFDLKIDALKPQEKTNPVPKAPPGGPDNKKPTDKKPMDKKTRLTLIGIGAGVLLIIIGIIFIAIAMNKGEKNTYSYNYTQGMECYNANQYSEALSYFEKAITYEEGKKNVDLKMKMYECYIDIQQEEKGIQMLNDVLNVDKYNEKAITTLLKYYSEKKDGNNITRLVKTYIDTNGEKYIAQYIVQQPTASVASGSYTDAFELELKASNGCKIYYTSDDTEPTANSTAYVNPIKIENGEKSIKAIAVNDIGVASRVLELKYIVNYQVPQAPEVTPASGTYEAGTKITIAGLNEGDTAYYTLDGTAPTKQSQIYKEPFDMPEGNTIVSVMVVNKYDLESSVTKKNYIVAKTNSYTFEEVKELLIARMKSRGDLKADGTTLDGSSISFVYYAKTTVNKEEMYLMYFDIRYNGKTERQDYYFGVGSKTGKCYRVYEKNGAYTVTDY